MTAQGKPSDPAHDPGTRKGEELKEREGVEPGRQETETTGAERPTGESSGRFSTSISPQDPIDPKSPKMPPA